MSPSNRAALIALQRRLGHTEAIARVLSRQDGDDLHDAVGGIALLLTDMVTQVDALLEADPD